MHPSQIPKEQRGLLQHRGPRRQHEGDTLKDRTNKGLALKLKTAIAILLIVYGIVSLLIQIGWYKEGTYSLDNTFWLKALGFCVVFGGGAIVYLNKKHDTRVIIGATGIIIGLADLIATSLTIYNNLKISEVTDLIFIIVYAAIPIMDVCLILLSIRYMQGHRRNAIRMSICVAVPLIIYVLEFIIAISLMRDEPKTFWLSVSTALPAAILYGVFFWFLLLPSIREDISDWKVYKLTRDVYAARVVDPKSSIFRADLIALMEKMKNVDEWEDSDSVPDSKEYSVTFGKDMNIREMTFRRMNGTETIRVSIIPANSKEYIQATRFDLREIVPLDGYFSTCKTVRFFGNDGYFIDINVRDDQPKPRKTYAIDRLIDRLKFYKVTNRRD